jgi:hypothetical protein
MQASLSLSFLSIPVGQASRSLQLSARCAAALLLVSSAFTAVASPAPNPLSLAAASTTVAAPATGVTPPRNSGAIDFAIVIPAVLRLLKNDHPAELRPLAGPASLISALQRVVLVSTLRSGFCMDLRLNPLPVGQTPVADWQVSLAALSGAAAASGARVEAFEGGWRVCTRRAGRFELALQHAFSLQPSAVASGPALTGSAPGGVPGVATTLGWPVALSLSTP